MGRVGKTTPERIPAEKAMLLAEWGSSNGSADINGDGIINAVDLSIMLANWG